MSRKKILILSFSNLHSDPRILRQYQALKDTYELSTCAYTPFKDTGISFHPIYQALPFSISRKIKRLFQFLTQQHDAVYWDDNKKRVAEFYRNSTFDIIIANDIATLPLAIKIASGKAKVLFDSHDFHPREFEEHFKWRLMHQRTISYLCKKYIPQTNAFTTASDGFVKAYEDFTKCTPVVVNNAAFYCELSPTAIDPNHIKLINHGAAIPTRKLELMIEMMNFADKKFHLDFLLIGNETYINILKKRAADNSNIRFLDPVPTNDLPRLTNNYDLGVYILNPGSLNNRILMPNKLFEYVQARIGSIVSPNQEMSKFVKKYDVGKVSKDYTGKAMADLLNALTVEEMTHYKNQANRYAKELSAEETIKKINEIVLNLLNN